MTLTPAQTRKRAASKAAKKVRRGWRKGKGVWPVRDENYKNWIRSLPCLICRIDLIRSSWLLVEFMRNIGLPVLTPQFTRTEAAHTGPHALGRKAGDDTCIPLCKNHHTEARDSYHKLSEKPFEAHHDIIITEIVSQLQAIYLATSRAA